MLITILDYLSWKFKWNFLINCLFIRLKPFTFVSYSPEPVNQFPPYLVDILFGFMRFTVLFSNEEPLFLYGEKYSYLQTWDRIKHVGRGLQRCNENVCFSKKENSYTEKVHSFLKVFSREALVKFNFNL